MKQVLAQAQEETKEELVETKQEVQLVSERISALEEKMHSVLGLLKAGAAASAPTQ